MGGLSLKGKMLKSRPQTIPTRKKCWKTAKKTIVSSQEAQREPENKTHA